MLKHKIHIILKKALRLLIIATILLVFISSIASVLIQNSQIQTFLVNKIANQLSQKYKAKITIKKVDFNFFNRLILNNVLIFDQQNDTLLFIDELDAGIVFIKLKKQKLFFNNIKIKKALACITKDENEIYNFQFLFNKKATNDSLNNKWDFSCTEFKIIQSTCRYSSFDKKNQPYGINYKNVEINNLNASVNKVNIHNNKTTLSINNLNFVEKSGFYMDNFTSDLSIFKTSLFFSNLHLSTSKSNINANNLQFYYNNIKDFSHFSYKVKIKSAFKKSVLHLADFSYFAPSLKNLDQKIVISGIISGRLNNLKLKKLNLKFGDFTHFEGNVTINGLPDINNSFFFVKSNKFITTKSDIEKIPLPPFNLSKTLKLPDKIKLFGTLHFFGEITGFIKEFVIYGNLKTDLGELFTDAKIDRNNENNIIKISGDVESNDFNIGNFLQTNNYLGLMSGRSNIKGFIEPGKQMEFTLNAKLKSIDINNYTYQNINLSGVVFDKRFDGSVIINDPNLNLDFFGRIDYSKDTPVFNFNADILKANLNNLQIDIKNSTSNLALSLTANFEGNSIDNINGRIDIYNANYQNQRDTIVLKKLSVFTNKLENEKELVINSDYLDGKIFGKYNFIALADIIKNLGNILLPSVTNKTVHRNEKYINDFKFKLNLKNTDNLSLVFFPDFSISPNTIFGGYYNSNDRSFEAICHSNEINVNNKKFSDLELKAEIKNEKLQLAINCKKLYLNKTNFIENYNLETSIKHDTIKLKTIWDNKDSILYRGYFSANCIFSRIDSAKNLKTQINIFPSELVLADSLWKVTQTQLIIDSSAIFINDFLIAHKKQFFALKGIISKLENDTLYAKYNNINLDLFNDFAKQKGFELSGILNGSSNLTSFYNNKLFTSALFIENASLNNEPLGNINIKSYWDKLSKKVLVNAQVKRENVNTVLLIGDYTPSNQSINFDLNLNKLRIKILQPYFKEVSSDLRGIASGNLKLEGTLSNPVLLGDLKVQKASFNIDYLKTKYNFSNIITLNKNKIVLEKIKLYDSDGNLAIVNGIISHKYFRDYSFNLNIEANNYLLLNTKEKDNNLYFGTAYGSGLINISGTPENLIMDISAKTEKNTIFYIPLTSSDIATQNNYITFVNDEFIPEQKKETYNVDLSGIQLNFDLEVTPDAEVQIIFDSKVGDVIKGKGNAELNMKINTLGNFTMYGDYNIVEGNYLFTLQNVINKKFDIEQGGKISWNGDPYNADLDLKAIYSIKKASIMDLIPDSSYKSIRYPVDCQLLMTGKLLNPNIKFNIDIPPPSEPEKEYIKSIISGFPEDEMNKQLISLLVLNRFQPYFNLGQTVTTPIIADINDAKKSATELLSNQLSHWLSQISDDVDLGLNYQLGDDISSQQVEIALSTQLLNDRLTIDTNFGIGGQNPNNINTSQNSSNIISDFILGIKLNKSGKLRMAVYNKANTNYYEYETAPYTQGIGLFYQEEFNNFSDLFKRNNKK
ncbi:MAG: translocation/assembly module TamB [Chlorobi bacterium]|nr:translocation/assembly module TamB [Chlorobiota bacterium]